MWAKEKASELLKETLDGLRETLVARPEGWSTPTGPRSSRRRRCAGAPPGRNTPTTIARPSAGVRFPEDQAGGSLHPDPVHHLRPRGRPGRPGDHVADKGTVYLVRLDAKSEKPIQEIDVASHEGYGTRSLNERMVELGGKVFRGDSEWFTARTKLRFPIEGNSRPTGPPRTLPRRPPAAAQRLSPVAGPSPPSNVRGRAERWPLFRGGPNAPASGREDDLEDGAPALAREGADAGAHGPRLERDEVQTEARPLGAPHARRRGAGRPRRSGSDPLEDRVRGRGPRAARRFGSAASAPIGSPTGSPSSFSSTGAYLRAFSTRFCRTT